MLLSRLLLFHICLPPYFHQVVHLDQNFDLHLTCEDFCSNQLPFLADSIRTLSHHILRYCLPYIMNAAAAIDCERLWKLLFLLNFPESEVEPVGLFNSQDYMIERDEG